MKRQYNHDCSVEKFYTEHHKKQTFVWSAHMRNNCKFGYIMGFEEMCELGDKLIDPSDPDLQLSQLHHAIQTAEMAKTKFPQPRYDWLHLTAFIHDLGKGPLANGLALRWKSTVNDMLWSVVGDTLPLGCEYSKHCVYPELFKDNPDYGKYEGMGIYTNNCGFDNMIFSFGHDEYMAQIIERSNTMLPQQAVDIIRYHSFYPWHQHEAYKEFSSDKDLKNLEWLQIFQEFDLYSKRDIPVETNLDYYKSLCTKYIPNGFLT